MVKFKTFSDALTAAPVAANDNKPHKARKQPEPRYRGTLPTLRWLYDNHPDLAESVADAINALQVTGWQPDAVDNDQQIRPTVGELVKASTDPDTGEHLPQAVERDTDGNTFIRIGALRFRDGELVEYGHTKKGRKLEPRDRIVSRDEEPKQKRNPSSYLAFRGAVPSPLHADTHQRGFSGEPALAPMYDPQTGVESARAELKRHGVDGSVAFENLPFQATRCRTVVAKGADFLGGVVGISGTSSKGAVMWESPSRPKGEVLRIIEEIASGSTLKEIGERMGLQGARVDRMAKDLVTDAAKVLIAANDNRSKKNAA